MIRKEWNGNCYINNKDFRVLLAVGRLIEHGKY